MKRFTRLYFELDATNRTGEKVAALERYFAEAPPADAAWALYFLTGRRVKRAVPHMRLREWAAEAAGLPLWLLEECYDAVGDLSETIALLLPAPGRMAVPGQRQALERAQAEGASGRVGEGENPGTATPQTERAPAATLELDFGDAEAAAVPHSPTLPLSHSAAEGLGAAAVPPLSPDVPLHQFAARCIAPLPALPEEAKRRLLFEVWAQLDARERFVWHKLIGGSWRVGVSSTLVVRALARVAGVEPAIMAHRITGDWEPTEQAYLRILRGATGATGATGAAGDPGDAVSDPGQPFPFYLAHPLEGEPAELGERGDWQVEWKWDGIRAQVIRRAGQTLIWSRGEELVTDRFPEITEAARRLPDGTVLDGELLCWRGEAPLPFAVMQRRIGRKTVGPKIRAEAPVAFVAFDILEHGGRDIREEPLSTRRALLQATLASLPGTALRLSPVVDAASWAELGRLRDESRARGVEGFMLKRLSSPYGVGRRKGDWWKWKIEPYTIDAVLIYAQRGHGRRASLYTDYTFAVRSGDELVPVAKAYSGLDDDEIRRVDRFVRENTIQKFGPVRAVKPELVFELAFEGVQESTRHRAGIAVRFPRIARWRHDKRIEEADTLDTLRELVRAHAARGGA